MRIGQRKLMSVLEDTLGFVQRPDADFSWSSWEDTHQAVLEIKELIARVSEGDRSALQRISVLFLPTGPLQELSLSSGWGKEFLSLADSYDRAAFLWRLRIPFL